jgi:hypothetical protein
MTKHLKSLRHFNAGKAANEHGWNVPRRNGIACPECKDELWDTEPDCTIETSPAQKKVNCRGCGYKGFRAA